jgi:hypothetical protein
VIIYAYDQHVWLLSPEPMVIDKPQSTRVEGASIVMKSCCVLEVRFYGKCVGQDLNIVPQWCIAFSRECSPVLAQERE